MATLQLGALACVSAAVLWAVAVALFGAVVAEHGARFVNLAKSLLASLVLVAATLASGGWPALVAAPGTAVLALAASGLVGISLGDTALFAAVDRLGLHRALLLQTTAPLFTAAIAAAAGESLTRLQVGGGVLVLTGVALVVLAPAGEGRGRRRGSLPAGLLVAVVAAAGQGVGVVLAKVGAPALPALPATLVRLLAASAGLLLVAAAAGRLRLWMRTLSTAATLRRVALPTLLGTVTGMVLQMVGVALAPATVAAVLLSTTPVFSLLIESWLGRRWPSLGAALGTLLAVAGVAVLSTVG